MSKVSTRAQEILEDIERHAAERRAAMAVAPGPLSGPAGSLTERDMHRLLHLIDAVIERAAHTEARIDALDATVAALRQRLDALPAASGGQEPTTKVAPACRPSDRARLAAIELAVTGLTRGEVDERLANEHGATDTEQLLNAIYGLDSDRTSRMPWGAS